MVGSCLRYSWIASLAVATLASCSCSDARVAQEREYFEIEAAKSYLFSIRERGSQIDQRGVEYVLEYPLAYVSAMSDRFYVEKVWVREGVEEWWDFTKLSQTEYLVAIASGPGPDRVLLLDSGFGSRLTTEHDPEVQSLTPVYARSGDLSDPAAGYDPHPGVVEP